MFSKNEPLKTLKGGYLGVMLRFKMLPPLIGKI